MNLRKISVTALTLGLTLGLCAPALAITNGVGTEPTHLIYNTRLIPQYSAGEYDGTLRLTINPNGIVSGTYIPSNGGPRIVSGGVKGDNIWLDFGFNGRMHVEGTIRNGHIVGYTTRGTQSWTFVANVTSVAE